jgi:excisionase family DNA binding protein
MREALIASKAKKPWIDKKAIASHFGCSVRHIGNLTRSRKLPYIKLGRLVRFDVDDCDKAIRAFEVKSVGSFQSFSQ